MKIKYTQKRKLITIKALMIFTNNKNKSKTEGKGPHPFSLIIIDFYYSFLVKKKKVISNCSFSGKFGKVFHLSHHCYFCVRVGSGLSLKKKK